MAKHSFWFRFKKAVLKSRQQRFQGFTLLELLVVTAIAGIIVSGLTYIVVQMMSADQREASRSDTQREMQMALDYMSAELREAIYVYPGKYLECGPRLAIDGSCTESFTKFLPTAVNQNSVPVLAFWKQQPFPDAVKARCALAAQNGVACLAGQSYALVVYSLRKNEAADNPRWQGKARITRYVLSQFDSNGNLNAGYVDPSAAGTDFTTWPYGKNETTGAFTNLQTATPTGNADTLVDFVGFNFGDAGLATQIGQTGSCPDLPSANPTDPNVEEYQIAPSNNMLTGAFAGARSFYACVAAPTRQVKEGAVTKDLPDPTRYRDVILFLRGSAAGRPGISSDEAGGGFLKSNNPDILPTLQTRVLSRSVLGRSPTE